jgi:hypothetical protein
VLVQSKLVLSVVANSTAVTDAVVGALRVRVRVSPEILDTVVFTVSPVPVRVSPTR